MHRIDVRGRPSTNDNHAPIDAVAEPRRLRYRLRTLFGLVTGCAILFFACNRHVQWQRAQRKAAEQIARSGGTVVTEPLGPRWLRKLVGQEYLTAVTEVYFGSRYIEPRAPGMGFAGYTPITGFDRPVTSRVKRVYEEELQRSHGEGPFWHIGGGLSTDILPNYDFSQVGDADLAALRPFSELRRLVLRWTGTSDVGLQHVKGLRRLVELNLRGTKITDTGLAAIKELPNLRILILSETNVTDAGLAHLSEMVTLRELHLTQTRVTDAGLVHLKSLTNLEALRLDRTDVTDAALPELAGLRKLKDLDLSWTQISDTGLDKLATMSHLEKLWVRHSECTVRGLRKLENQIPDAVIIDHRY